MIFYSLVEGDRASLESLWGLFMGITKIFNKICGELKDLDYEKI